MLAADKSVKLVVKGRLDRANSLLRSRFGGQPYIALSLSTFEPGFSLKRSRMLRQGFISKTRPKRRLLSPGSAACLEESPYGRVELRQALGEHVQLQLNCDKLKQALPSASQWAIRCFRGQRKSPNRLRPDTVSRRSLETDSTMSGRSLAICTRESRQKRSTSAMPRSRAVRRTDVVMDSEEVAGWEAR